MKIVKWSSKDHAYYYVEKKNAAEYFGVNFKVYTQLAAYGEFTTKSAIRCSCKKGKDHFSKDWREI